MFPVSFTTRCNDSFNTSVGNVSKGQHDSESHDYSLLGDGKIDAGDFLVFQNSSAVSFLTLNDVDYVTTEQNALYPSRMDIESIVIPTCDEAFDFPSLQQRIVKPKETDHFKKEQITPKRPPARLKDPLDYASVHTKDSSVAEAEYIDVLARGPFCPKSTENRRLSFKHQLKPKKLSSRRLELEISPGFFLPLHGSEEMKDRMEQGEDLQRCACFSCWRSLFTVMDASSVLCPACKSLSPIVDPYTGLEMNYGTGGVGLGMKEKVHARWKLKQELQNDRCDYSMRYHNARLYDDELQHEKSAHKDLYRKRGF